MKRLISVLLLVVMLFTLCACGAKKSGGKESVTFGPKDTTTTTETTTEKETEKTTEKTTEKKTTEKKTDEAFEEGLDLWYGRKGEYDRERALTDFTKSAKDGNADAYFFMGMIHESYDDFERWPQVKKYFQKAIDGGSDLGTYGMALCYYYGAGEKQDYAKAKELAKQLIDKGSLSGYIIYGMLYNNGHGVEENEQQAVKCYSKAVKADEWYIRNYARLCLGAIYENQDESDDENAVETDYEAAMKNYKAALDDGDVRANIYISELYRGGKGVEQDEAKAFSLRKKAATEGGYYYELGLYYLYGYGTDQDYDKAMKCFKKDIEVGKSAAFDMYAIAWMYVNGNGVEKDEEEAFDWAEDCIAVAGFGDNGAKSNAQVIINNHKGK